MLVSFKDYCSKYCLYMLGIASCVYVMRAYMAYDLLYAIISAINVFSVVILVHAVKEYLSFQYYKEYVLIFFALLFSMLPFCINDFFYYDDLWSFSSQSISLVGVAVCRPFIDLYANIISPLYYTQTSFVRMMLIFVHYFFAISFYTYLRNKTFNENIGIFLTVLLSCNVLAVDFIGYLSIFPVIISNLYIFYAYINWKMYKNEKNIKDLLVGFVLFISACMYYPIIVPIIFGYILIDMIFEKENNNTVLWYIVIYGMGMIFYLAIAKLILMLFDMSVSSRAMTIATYEEALFKLKWFIFDVIPSTLNHLLTCFCGNLFTKNNCMFYTIEFDNFYITQILIVLFIIAISYVSYKFFSEKRYFYCCYLLLSLPMSFMFWLILNESTILTYYTYPLFFCIGVIVISAMWYVFRGYEIKDEWDYNIIGAMTLMVVISSNIYANNFWVKYNVAGYEFIRNTISSNINEEIRHIHIYGKLNPMQINTYAVMATKLILKDMGLDYNTYKITASDNESILSGMTYDEKDSLYIELSDYQKKIFDENYVKSEGYSVYSLKSKERTDKEWFDIKCMLVAGGVLPEKKDHTIIVDLNNGFVKYNKF